jgi:hypothetical protein
MIGNYTRLKYVKAGDIIELDGHLLSGVLSDVDIIEEDLLIIVKVGGVIIYAGPDKTVLAFFWEKNKNSYLFRNEKM